MKETGRKLKEQREKSNLTIEQISESLKISSRVLRAIEDNQENRFPPRVFLRGFVQSFAQYVGADVNEIMDCFNKEMRPEPSEPVGNEASVELPPPSPTSQNPTVAKMPEEPAPVVIKPPKKEPSAAKMKKSSTKKKRAVWAVDYKKWSLAAKTFIIIIVAVLVGLIFFVTQMVEKYERESMVKVEDNLAVPPIAHDEEAILGNNNNSIDEPNEGLESNVVTTDENDEITTQMPPVEATSNTANETTPEVPTQKAPESSVVTNKPETSQPAAIAEAPKVEQSPAEEVSPEPSQPVTQTPPEAVVEPEDSALRSPVSSGAQEVIVEAFDQVQIKYRLDDQSIQTITMAPGDLRTLKADQKIRIEASNGGVINVFHNGTDIGVPGRIGEKLKLRYP